jgi:peroxin-6
VVRHVANHLGLHVVECSCHDLVTSSESGAPLALATAFKEAQKYLSFSLFPLLILCCWSFLFPVMKMPSSLFYIFLCRIHYIYLLSGDFFISLIFIFIEYFSL